MAYRTFNPGERDRNWREPWRSERDDASYQARQRYGGGESDDFERRGWRQGSDYYGDDMERYGGRRYGGSLRDDRSPEVWRGGRDEWSDERYHGRGLSDAFGDFTSPDHDSMLRWSDADAGSMGGSDWRRDRGDSREERYDPRSAGETRRWRSDVSRYGGWGSLASAMGVSAGGEFKGRGPRGYRRSDERIREEVCDLLTDDPRIDASDVEVNVENGEVTLSGTVDSRTEKRRAEDLIEVMPGVKDVHNRLRTKQPGLLERAAEAMRPHSTETTRTEHGARR
jgi:hypothetical protein